MATVQWNVNRYKDKDNVSDDIPEIIDLHVLLQFAFIKSF